MNDQLHILIVDDDRRMASTLADILALQGFVVEQAFNGPEAIEKARQQAFDCALSDIKMPGMDGVALFQALQDIQPGLPVVLMTAYASDTLIRQGQALGVLGVLEKPLDINQILSFLSSVKESKTIVIVDDDPAFCQTLGDILEARLFRVQKITDPHFPTEAINPQAQLVMVDMKLNSINGCDVLKQIRALFPALPALLVTGYRQEMAVAVQQALEINAYACLYKPLVIPELLNLLAEIRAHRLKKSLNELP